MTPSDLGDRCPFLKALFNDPALLVPRPGSTPALACRRIIVIANRHQRWCPSPDSGHDHRATLQTAISNIEINARRPPAQGYRNRSLRRHECAGTAKADRASPKATASRHELPLELVVLAAPSPSRGKARPLPKTRRQATTTEAATVVLVRRAAAGEYGLCSNVRRARRDRVRVFCRRIKNI